MKKLTILVLISIVSILGIKGDDHLITYLSDYTTIRFHGADVDQTMTLNYENYKEFQDLFIEMDTTIVNVAQDPTMSLGKIYGLSHVCGDRDSVYMETPTGTINSVITFKFNEPVNFYQIQLYPPLPSYLKSKLSIRYYPNISKPDSPTSSNRAYYGNGSSNYVPVSGIAQSGNVDYHVFPEFIHTQKSKFYELFINVGPNDKDNMIYRLDSIVFRKAETIYKVNMYFNKPTYTFDQAHELQMPEVKALVVGADEVLRYRLTDAEGLEYEVGGNRIVTDLPPGEYTLTAYIKDARDYDTEETSTNIIVEGDISVGINELQTDGSQAKTIYDLYGRKMNNDNLQPGIYIIRDNKGVRKVVVK